MDGRTLESRADRIEVALGCGRIPISSIPE